MADKETSKWPDLNEVAGMAGKLFSDIKSSLSGICAKYKEKHSAQTTSEASSEGAKAEPAQPKESKASTEAGKEDKSE